jgi:hypothetical protein
MRDRKRASWALQWPYRLSHRTGSSRSIGETENIVDDPKAYIRQKNNRHVEHFD